MQASAQKTRVVPVKERIFADLGYRARPTASRFLHPGRRRVQKLNCGVVWPGTITSLPVVMGYFPSPRCLAKKEKIEAAL